MSGAAPLVSVVVSARGNASSLEGLLAALAVQSLAPADMEVVVVDNDPPAAGEPRPAAPPVKVIRFVTQRWPAAKFCGR